MEEEPEGGFYGAIFPTTNCGSMKGSVFPLYMG